MRLRRLTEAVAEAQVPSLARPMQPVRAVTDADGRAGVDVVDREPPLAVRRAHDDRVFDAWLGWAEAGVERVQLRRRTCRSIAVASGDAQSFSLTGAVQN